MRPRRRIILYAQTEEILSRWAYTLEIRGHFKVIRCSTLDAVQEAHFHNSDIRGALIWWDSVGKLSEEWLATMGVKSVRLYPPSAVEDVFDLLMEACVRRRGPKTLGTPAEAYR